MRASATCIRLAVGVAVLSAVSTVKSASAKSRDGMESGSARITLRVYDYVRLNHPALLAAENEASEILAQAGIEAHWVDCPTSRAVFDNYPDCQSAFGVDDFVLRVLPKAMVDSRAKWQEALGSTNPCESIGTCTANVFYDRASRMAEGASATLPVMLGRAMAHEIGHLLLGANSHSRTGIMRAFWSGRDLTLGGSVYLLFTREQSRQIRVRLAERAQTWQAQMRIGELARQ